MKVSKKYAGQLKSDVPEVSFEQIKSISQVKNKRLYKE